MHINTRYAAFKWITPLNSSGMAGGTVHALLRIVGSSAYAL
jgi:ribulose 1,5-bisphosphate carboxylase large subunit-like protein